MIKDIYVPILPPRVACESVTRVFDGVTIIDMALGKVDHKYSDAQVVNTKIVKGQKIEVIV